MSFLHDRIKSVVIGADHLGVELQDGRALRLPLSLYPTLAEATNRQRSRWALCGAGTGIHWPLLNYDLSVAGLLRSEPEAPGIRRAKKTVRYPAHRTGKAAVLSEDPAVAASITSRRKSRTDEPAA